MALSDSSWQDCPHTVTSTGAYIIFYYVRPIDHVTHVPGPVSQPIADIEYIEAHTAGMDSAHVRMLIHELLSNDPDIVPEEVPLIILNSKSAVCMANNGKDAKHTRHISRIVYILRNGENYKIYKIDWCEGGLKLADTATKNVGENDSNTIMKYIMVRLEN